MTWIPLCIFVFQIHTSKLVGRGTMWRKPRRRSCLSWTQRWVRLGDSYLIQHCATQKKSQKKFFLGHFWHLRWWNLKILRGTIYEELDIKSFSYSCRMNHVLWGEKKTNASAHCLIPLFDFKFTMNPILTTLVFLYVWAKSSSALHFFLLWEVISIKFT